MIIATLIGFFRERLETIVLELCQESRVSAVSKVLVENLGFFESFGGQHSKGSSMIRPADYSGIFFRGKQAVKLL